MSSWVRLSWNLTFTLFLKDAKRARYTSASDEEALKAYHLVSKLENISPSLEPSSCLCSTAIKNRS